MRCGGSGRPVRPPLPCASSGGGAGEAVVAELIDSVGESTVAVAPGGAGAGGGAGVGAGGGAGAGAAGATYAAGAGPAAVPAPDPALHARMVRLAHRHKAAWRERSTSPSGKVGGGDRRPSCACRKGAFERRAGEHNLSPCA